jgi:hypothetical protein
MAHPLVSHRAMQEAVAHAAIPLPPRKKRPQAGDPADPPAGFVLNERGALVRIEEADRATVLVRWARAVEASLFRRSSAAFFIFVLFSLLFPSTHLFCSFKVPTAADQHIVFVSKLVDFLF